MFCEAAVGISEIQIVLKCEYFKEVEVKFYAFSTSALDGSKQHCHLHRKSP
jgi:hypothetical protein